MKIKESANSLLKGTNDFSGIISLFALILTALGCYYANVQKHDHDADQNQGAERELQKLSTENLLNNKLNEATRGLAAKNETLAQTVQSLQIKMEGLVTTVSLLRDLLLSGKRVSFNIKASQLTDIKNLVRPDQRLEVVEISSERHLASEKNPLSNQLAPASYSGDKIIKIIITNPAQR